MGSRDDPLVIDEGAAAVVVADIDRHLPGLWVVCALVAAHNPVIRRCCSCGVKKIQKSSYLSQLFIYLFCYYPKTIVHAHVIYLQHPGEREQSDQSSRGWHKPSCDQTGREWPTNPCIYTFYSSVSFHALPPPAPLLQTSTPPPNSTHPLLLSTPLGPSPALINILIFFVCHIHPFS